MSQPNAGPGPIEERLRTTLQSLFTPIHFELLNESHMHAGSGPRETHFRVLIVSPIFEGLSRVERQRKVYDAVRDELQPGKVHALAQRLLTPAEWTPQSADTFTAPECHGGSKREKI